MSRNAPQTNHNISTTIPEKNMQSRMKYGSIAAGPAGTVVIAFVAGTLALPTASLGAQVARSAPPVIAYRSIDRSVVLLPDGQYVITLTPERLARKSAQSVQPIELDAQIVHSGSSVTMTASDGTVLNGSASATHIKANGLAQALTLAVELGGTGTTAGGTFLLADRSNQNHKIEGTVAVAPAPRMRAHKQGGGMGGCSGLMGCARMIWDFFASGGSSSSP